MDIIALSLGKKFFFFKLLIFHCSYECKADKYYNYTTIIQKNFLKYMCRKKIHTSEEFLTGKFQAVQAKIGNSYLWKNLYQSVIH